MFMGSLLDKYDSDTTYDEYLGEDNKLRKQAKVISSILEKIGSKKLQEIEKKLKMIATKHNISYFNPYHYFSQSKKNFF